MRVALYARTSTSEHQNPETQLLRLRDYVAAHPDWVTVGEYVDQASANDLLHRTAWRKLLDDGIRHKYDAVLVFKLDRGFRSVKHMHDTLAIWGPLGIGFLSAQENLDTTSAAGRLLVNVIASLAEFELELIRERVTAGMDRARREGKRIGRPTADEKKVRKALAMIKAGASQRQASRATGVSPSTIRHYLSLEGRVEKGVESEAPETAI